ncbi:aminotransferase class V-fold PLP-dependent enzyme [Arenibaculum sp.]|jgi:selenocysteine lyase/cysteine desulfurase|uniref:aminotransferase class V-fold PLP-dependent enzyme n=1 Tax=Arenibaculum sp. TaxID=2865862 RepID=UPI002E0F73F9|nr:aminotransferase class V-fold PLP-dependent enzyme [Arenibaculum sp.]
MTIDVARARAETPGTAHVAHFNNAGSSLPPSPVLDAVHGHLDLEARIGGYEAEAEAAPRLARTRAAVAEMLNCGTDEVALVENATVGWDMAFHSLSFGPGDRILTSVSEYASNYIAFLQVARRTGVVVEAVPNDADGQLDPEALERMIDGRVRLIAVTHVPTNGGLVNPAREIGRVARAHGIVYLLDACQSAGQMPLDVEEIGCDLLSATGRKYLRGPRGTGFLYVRRTLLDRLEPPFVDLHAATWVAPDRYELRPDARRFENWESNVAGLVGLGVAVDYALSWGLDAIRDRVVLLAEHLRGRLESVPGVVVRDLGRERCGIVGFTADGRPADAVKAALAARGINVSISTAGSTRLDMEARGLDELVRASVHYYNTEEEIERLVSALR